MKKHLIFISLCLIISAFVITSCKKEKDKLPEYVAFNKDNGDDLGEADYMILGLNDYGAFYTFYDDKPNIPQRLIITYESTEEAQLIIYFDEEGLPETLISENFVFVLGNFEGNKFNAAIVTKDGECELFEDIETDINWDEYKQSLSELGQKRGEDLHYYIKKAADWANVAAGAVGCGISVYMSAGLSLSIVGAVTWGFTAVKCYGVIGDFKKARGVWESSNEMLEWLGPYGRIGGAIKSCATSWTPLIAVKCAVDVVVAVFAYENDLKKGKKDDIRRGWEKLGEGSSNGDGVVINGVKWASKNVNLPGTFTASPSEKGMLYLWNNRLGWSSTDPMVNSNGGGEDDWGGASSPGATWAKANDPCPEGWRVPTRQEWSSLKQREWATIGGVDGCKAGDGEKFIFLPLAGYRYLFGGMLWENAGRYWSSTANDDYDSWAFNFTPGIQGFGVWNYSISSAFSVRCVAE